MSSGVEAHLFSDIFSRLSHGGESFCLAPYDSFLTTGPKYEVKQTSVWTFWFKYYGPIQGDGAGRGPESAVTDLH